MSKTFGVAGVSKLNGEVKARFAQDMDRVKVLEKNGHTDIKLFQLPQPMTKEDALLWLVEHFTDADKDQYLAIRSAQPSASKPAAPAGTRALAAKAEKPAKAAKTAMTNVDGVAITETMLAKKREMFPSHTDEQLADLIRYQMRQVAKQYPGLSEEHVAKTLELTVKHFDDIEPNF